MDLGLIVAGVIGVVGSIFLISRMIEKKRTAAVQNAAMRMGYTFEADGTRLLEELSHFNLLQQGHSKRLKNVVLGGAGDVDFKVFDYRYTTGSGKNSSTHSHTVVLAASRHLNMPSFLLKPENVFHKIGQAFGYQDIDFDSHPTFSKKYLLRGQSEHEIRAYFEPRLLEMFQENAGLQIEGARSEMLLIKPRTKPEDLRSLLDDATRLHNALAGR